MVAETSYMRFRGSGDDAAAPSSWQILTDAGARRRGALSAAGRRRGRALCGAAAPVARRRGCGCCSWGAAIALRSGEPARRGRRGRKYLDMARACSNSTDGCRSAGRSSSFGMSGFADGQVGYRSAGQSGDEIRAEVTTGVRPTADMLLLAQGFILCRAWSRRCAFHLLAKRLQVSAVYDADARGRRAARRARRPARRRSIPPSAACIGALWYRF